MNKLKCKDCVNYDPVAHPQRRGSHGRCIPRSVYPALEAAGQVFPSNAVRQEDPQAPGKLHIVQGNTIIPHCTLAKAKKK